MTAPDPSLRRDTPLARKLITRIRQRGPISVRDYMDACLNDPENGYYRTRTAVGRAGDFITAPEISQVFGELLGLWCVVVWQQMGQPNPFNLIELGAGRGTLLADALRAARVVPGFLSAVAVHILDCNPALIEQQRAALAGAGVLVSWHETLASLPRNRSSIWLANEFMDTIPVDQWENARGHWQQRLIGLDATGHLAFATSGSTSSLREQQQVSDLVSALLSAAAPHAMAGLFIDYGGTGGEGPATLQAVREHHYEHVLTSPGEADLSVQVDFSAFQRALLASGGSPPAQPLAADGPIAQAEFLGRLGIVERASKLMAANPAKANALETGVARLLAPQGMGTRFQVLGVRSGHLPPLPGF